MRKLFTTAYNVSTLTSSHPHAVRRLCVGSAESEDQQVRTPGYLVQVHSLISTASYKLQVDINNNLLPESNRIHQLSVL